MYNSIQIRKDPDKIISLPPMRQLAAPILGYLSTNLPRFGSRFLKSNLEWNLN
jgi:hypothetical protein